MQENNKPSQNIEQGVEEALEGELAAAELRILANALTLRRARLHDDLSAEPDETEQARLEALISEIDVQIHALLEEASISQFVEETVRFSHQVRQLNEG